MNFKMKLIAVALATAGLTACGGGSSNSTPAPTPAPAPAPTPAPTNSAPTDITLSNASVNENAAGAQIGTLSAVDANSGDTFTFAVDNDLFAVSGNTLSLAANRAVNFEAATSHTVNVTVTDNSGAAFSKAMTINVTDRLDYDFASKVTDATSSTNYSGQTARQAQIAQLNHYIANTLQGEINATNGPLRTRQDVINKLYSFFHLNSENSDTTATDGLNQTYALYAYSQSNTPNLGANLPVTFEANAEQKTIGAISSSHKDLRGKLAGNDASRMHKPWNDGTSFVGWPGATTPTNLVAELFKQLADNAEAQLNGTIRRDEATNTAITKVYVNTNGTDLKQLIQKFLLMGVNFSQGTDDYLDEGIATDRDNVTARSDNSTALEHGYDEGFGYFGAARDYTEYTDDEIASKGGRDNYQGEHDTDGNGTINLLSEINFSASVNAAKRDRGSASNPNPTNFTKDAIEAFIAGRALIRSVTGQLSAEQQTTLVGHRNVAVGAWEKAIAATVIHYINDVTSDLGKSGTADYSFEDVAKHFSEMKGFSIGLQFNPNSPLSDAQFAQIQNLMGTQPVLLAHGSTDMTAVNAYLAGLRTARDVMQTAYSFDATNVENW
ncbi:cadherin repeat domain-containing protein [Endozoicomonas sp. G2_1]|uniref:cadherin repeat domain-containing protein n=1 Tax=Endozoicomonas sp. G2_1 TaxID=2821091 RepID=UPI001ADBC0C2|nr:cadherin repeat domain-containing protein [Endozoicomonas sp. G2_1]MBO9490044.1 cadherin repeat domain-containing protein [Endozoicomonas sp. G2_1]